MVGIVTRSSVNVTISYLTFTENAKDLQSTNMAESPHIARAD